MARTDRRGPLGAPMSRAEIIGGFLYFPFYLAVVPWLLHWLPAFLWVPLSEPLANFLYFCVNFIAVLLIFRRWLAASLAGAGRRFWETVQAAVLGFAFYYALFWLLSRVFGLLRLEVADPNDAYLRSLDGGGWPLLYIGALFLVPPAEETLFRGLIFGNLRERGRILSYAVSALVFAAAHVWRYIGPVGWTGTLLAALRYLPAGIALGWCYEKSDTVWAPIVAHSLLNAAALGLLRLG